MGGGGLWARGRLCPQGRLSGGVGGGGAAKGPGGETGVPTAPCSGFSLATPGRPLPGEGPGGEQVSAVGRLLYLERARPAQEGTYTCECSNVAGNSSRDHRLVVHGELRPGVHVG